MAEVQVDLLALSTEIALAAKEIRQQGFVSTLGRYKDTVFPPWTEKDHRRHANHRIKNNEDGTFTALIGKDDEPLEFPSFQARVVRDNTIFSPR
jgi:hypothetical protein